MKESETRQRKFLKHLGTNLNYEYPTKPHIAIYIKSKKLEEPEVTIQDPPEVRSLNSPNNLPSKKDLKSIGQSGSLNERKSKNTSLVSNKSLSPGYSLKNEREDSLFKFLKFPTSFKVKKLNQQSNRSVLYMMPEQKISMIEKYADDRIYIKSQTPTIHKREPTYITNSSFRAGYFNSRIDKILQNYRPHKKNKIN